MKIKDLPVMEYPLRDMERGVDNFIERIFDTVHDLSGNGFFVKEIRFEDSKHATIYYRRKEPLE